MQTRAVRETSVPRRDSVSANMLISGLKKDHGEMAALIASIREAAQIGCADVAKSRLLRLRLLAQSHTATEKDKVYGFIEDRVRLEGVEHNYREEAGKLLKQVELFFAKHGSHRQLLTTDFLPDLAALEGVLQDGVTHEHERLFPFFLDLRNWE
ncbi:MAG: hypothetical protein LC131_07345 [Anaerolineae bacterium]|nr:hypothetical protein [Anaerolineae bacterium]